MIYRIIYYSCKKSVAVPPPFKILATGLGCGDGKLNHRVSDLKKI